VLPLMALTTIAFPLITTRGPRCRKSDFVTEETQYVQDDDGIYTRRYAVMRKPKDVMSGLVPDGQVVKGKLQHRLGVTNRGGTVNPLAPDPETYQVRDFEDRVGKPSGTALDKREILHVHQELGSTDAGRGLCLTSVSLSQNQMTGDTWKTNLKTMYCNPGSKFEDPGNTVLVLVDLSKVPSGHAVPARPGARIRRQLAGSERPALDRKKSFTP
jgi:hypothetical protein